MAPERRPHLLIFEPDSRGHVREWLGHIARGTTALRAAARFTLLVAPEMASALGGDGARAFEVRALDEREQARCLDHRLAVSGFARWNTMRRHLDRSGATHGLFLALDHLSLPLALGLGAGGRPLSGILFRPSVHYRRLTAQRPTPTERVRDLRKDVLYRLMLANPALVEVLSLDPYFPALAAARYRGGAKVAPLSDPAFPLPQAAPPLPPGLDAPRQRTRFVLFGELTARKGILELIDALGRLPHQVAANTAVIVAGRIDPALRTAVTTALRRLATAQPELWLHIEERRLGDVELAALVADCHRVLIPYQRFVGSSGVLLWAAGLRRPVVCQDYGLLGHLTRHHRLGLVVDSTDSAALAGAIEAVVRDRRHGAGDAAGMAAFVAGRAPKEFAATVLERALGRRVPAGALGSAHKAPQPAMEWSQRTTP